MEVSMANMKRGLMEDVVMNHLQEFGMKDSDITLMSDVVLDKLCDFLIHNAMDRRQLEMEVEDLKLKMDDFRHFTLQYLRARGM
jgi:ribosome-interacting GTPase 1